MQARQHIKKPGQETPKAAVIVQHCMTSPETWAGRIQQLAPTLGDGHVWLDSKNEFEKISRTGLFVGMQELFDRMTSQLDESAKDYVRFPFEIDVTDAQKIASPTTVQYVDQLTMRLTYIAQKNDVLMETITEAPSMTRAINTIMGDGTQGPAAAHEQGLGIR